MYMDSKTHPVEHEYRPRLFKLSLTEAERAALIKMAIIRGIRPSEVLRDFINKNAPK
jgi:hypothetical protein